MINLTEKAGFLTFIFFHFHILCCDTKCRSKLTFHWDWNKGLKCTTESRAAAFAGLQSGTKLSAHGKLIQVSEVEEAPVFLTLSICYFKCAVDNVWWSAHISSKVINLSVILQGAMAGFKARLLAEGGNSCTVWLGEAPLRSSNQQRTIFPTECSIQILLIFTLTSLNAIKELNKPRVITKKLSQIVIYSAVIPLGLLFFSFEIQSKSYSGVPCMYTETKDTWTGTEGSKPVSFWLLLYRKPYTLFLIRLGFILACSLLLSLIKLIYAGRVPAIIHKPLPRACVCVQVCA